ncbi:MAG: CHAT domain-containing protein, partial [Austwickia sp.]|nr:CHAT domain-containing protein [Austwickia sp.]
VVHVAAHGDHQPESPLFSSLRMADGLVFAHELEPNPPSASLVVLSACEAGRGTARPGEEALGWPSALLALGVRTVIAPLVAVRDDEACAVMTDLHRHLAAGLPADAALAAAAGPTGTPFVCFGAPWAGVDPPLQSAEAPA